MHMVPSNYARIRNHLTRESLKAPIKQEDTQKPLENRSAPQTVPFISNIPLDIANRNPSFPESFKQSFRLPDNHQTSRKNYVRARQRGLPVAINYSRFTSTIFPGSDRGSRLNS